VNQKELFEKIARYREELRNMGYEKIDHPHDQRPQDNIDELEQCLFMLDAAEGFLKDGRLYPVQKWLGFVEGVLWQMNLYTLADLGYDDP
jgi:hypothetical protein